jgi:thiol-disulfide isomerase/thioredoxin
MKKYLKLFIAIVLISIIGYLGYSIATKLQHKKEVTARIKTIPAFSFKTLDGKIFTNKNLDKTKPKLFVYFNSECEFCQAEAESIHKELDNLKNIQLLFISYEETDKIKAFAQQYELLNVKNIVFLEDKNIEFAPLFGAKGIPFMLLYDKDNKLIQKFRGVTKIEKIVSHLPSSLREETKY